MKKSILTAALACVLSIGGIALCAQEKAVSFDKTHGVLSIKSESEVLNIVKEKSGKLSLAELMQPRGDGKSFGYLLNGNSETGKKFVSLSTSISSIETTDSTEAVSLGSFSKDDTVQFGYAQADGSGFSSVSIGSDAGFFSGMDTDSFFKLDFSENPFDGNIEVLVMGQPLPPATVTLLIALAAGAGLLFLHNRRNRAHAEQA